MENKQYKIETIEDISNVVTKENFENFMIDFLSVINKVVEIKEFVKEKTGEYPEGLMKDFIWIDDEIRGIKKLTIKHVKPDDESDN
jgi:hypothetical protein